MNIRAASTPRHLLLLFVLAGCVSGCQRDGGNQYQEPPPQEVFVSRPLQQDVIDYVEETGTTEACETVDIRARVEGYLEDIKFDPGQENIQEGDELFLIDQKPYRAIVTQAEAALRVAEAETVDAEAKYKRAVPLAQQGAVSQEELLEKAAIWEVSKAKVVAAQAQLDAANLDLGYTIVRSPISGRVGKTLVDKGNLVGKTMSTHLTTVIKYDPIYATFNISERMLLDVMDQRRQSGQARSGDDREGIKFYMGLTNEEGYPHEGHLNYADLAVDASTGTFQVRAEFKNPDYRIVPGLFVRIRIPTGERKGALLVPESAVGADQEGRYVLIVEESEGKKVVRRCGVTLGAKIGALRVVVSGLEPPDSVIVRGIQRVRSGSLVAPVEEELKPPSVPAPAQNATPAVEAAEPAPGGDDSAEPKGESQVERPRASGAPA